ncbi:hypothetical protein Lal_00021447 [Lupinus albus]|nr:hypothetical protein Lal_00021447 [Lupinus albus]
MKEERRRRRSEKTKENGGHEQLEVATTSIPYSSSAEPSLFHSGGSDGIIVDSITESTLYVCTLLLTYCLGGYGPFRNGEQLGGCAIRDSSFASTAPLEASQITSVWEGSKSVAAFGSPNAEIFERLVGEKVNKCVRDGAKDTILLPKNLWSSVKERKDGEKSVSEVGWLLDDGHAITSTCLFSSTANLEELSIALETRAPEDV